MGKKAKQVIVLSIGLFFSMMVCSLFAWGDDDIVSSNNYNYNAITSLNNVWCIAASKDTAHCVWIFDAPYYETWYARSTDNTETWGSFTEVSDGLSGNIFTPSIATVGDTVHVVWKNMNLTRDRIYYIKSTDKGANWESPVIISDDTTSGKANPCVRATGSYVYVTWTATVDIYFDRSTNNGSSWGTDQKVSNVQGEDESYSPSMAVDDANVDVVWTHYEYRSDREVYHRRNINHGASRSWGSIHNVSNDNSTNQSQACVADANSFIHVVWSEREKIWHARSSNGGSNWTERRIADSTTQHRPNVAATGTNVHVVWMDWRDVIANIYYARSYNNGYSWHDEVRLSDANEGSYNPSIDVITDNQDSDYRNLYVVWTEYFSGSNREVLADYEQYEYVVEYEPECLEGGQLMSDTDAKQFGIPSIHVSPVPMRTQTTVKYVLPKTRLLHIKVFDISGRCVRTLFEGKQNSGTYHITWDGKNQKGNTLESGVYFIKAKGIGEAKVIKLN